MKKTMQDAIREQAAAKLEKLGRESMQRAAVRRLRRMANQKLNPAHWR